MLHAKLPEPVDEAGQSPWANAWKRLRRNRLAVASGVFLVLLCLVGYGAPLLSAHLTHFSLDEQHSRLQSAPPGSQDVSYDHPDYDGNDNAFAAIDLDGDGMLRCHRVPAKILAHPGLVTLDRLSPPLAAEARASFDRLDEKLPIKEILRYHAGELRCPELDELTGLLRHFHFLMDQYDLARENHQPDRAHPEPDGFVSWLEFPKHDGELAARFRNRGLAGPEAFRRLDVDGDQVISGWEIGERTRYMRWERFAKEDLVGRFDADRDLAISRTEFPGAPVLRTFHLGTDGQGRDVLTRLLYGARISITIGLLTTLVSFLIGVTYGSISGYFGGLLDNLMMRIVDVLYGLPYMFIVIVLMVVAGRSTIMLFIALGAVQWLTMARVIRGQILSLKTREFVEAARALGAGPFAIIFRHLLRNTVGPVIVYSTLLVPAVILEEAFLSFLGFGVQPPDPSWGNMITEGKDKMETASWLILAPGVALATTLFAMNFLGDGVRDALDPKVRKA
jgi:oligopeptide transport system permease protein